MKLPDDYVQKHCESWLRYNGIYRGRKLLSILSLMHLYGQIFSILYLIYMAYHDLAPFNQCAQFISLGILYSGTLVTLLIFQKEIMYLAESCEAIPNIDIPWIEKEFRAKKVQVSNSLVRKWTMISTRIINIIAVQTVCSPLIVGLLNSQQPQLPLRVTGEIDDPWLFLFILSFQLMFFISAVTSCNGAREIFTLVIELLRAQFQTMKTVFLTLEENVFTDRIIKQCVNHHNKILNLFKIISDVYSGMFYVIYFGLFSATAISRSLLFGETIDLWTLPIFIAELSYIVPFCYAMEILLQENDNLRFSIYDSNWISFSKPVARSLRLIMTRTYQIPTVVLYKGGPPINMGTFTTIVSASFTYMISAALF